MSDLKFKEADKNKIIDYLNFVSNSAKFNLDTNQCIKYYALLTYMQKELLPKIEANIFEIEKVTKNKSGK